MKFRQFMQSSSQKIVALNLDLVEAILADDVGRGTILRFPSSADGEANYWRVTDDFNELVKSLRAEQT
jgi:hypothetical protein